MSDEGAKVTVASLAAMKRDARKIVAVVAWDYQMARIVDRVGVDIVSVGDTVGMNLWGQPHPFEVGAAGVAGYVKTLEECAVAVRIKEFGR